FFSSRRRHTRLQGDWSSDVCSSDLMLGVAAVALVEQHRVETGAIRLFGHPLHVVDAARTLEAVQREQRGAPAVRLPVAVCQHARSEERRGGKEWRAWRAAREVR